MQTEMENSVLKLSMENEKLKGDVDGLKVRCEELERNGGEGGMGRRSVDVLSKDGSTRSRSSSQQQRKDKSLGGSSNSNDGGGSSSRKKDHS